MLIIRFRLFKTSKK